MPDTAAKPRKTGKLSITQHALKSYREDSRIGQDRLQDMLKSSAHRKMADSLETVFQDGRSYQVRMIIQSTFQPTTDLDKLRRVAEIEREIREEGNNHSHPLGFHFYNITTYVLLIDWREARAGEELTPDALVVSPSEQGLPGETRTVLRAHDGAYWRFVQQEGGHWLCTEYSPSPATSTKDRWFPYEPNW